MSNRENLLAEILDDLNRSDMTTAASNAISSAIDFYGKERWYFLEGHTTITSSASQVYYPLPSDMYDPDSIMVNFGGSYEPLDRVNFLEINEKDTGVVVGEAEEYCIREDSIRFYPIAGSTTYTVVVSYHKILETSASASNAWTNVAKDLIRHNAAKSVLANKLKDLQGAKMTAEFEQLAYDQLRAIHSSKVSTGKFTKTDW